MEDEQIIRTAFLENRMVITMDIILKFQWPFREEICKTILNKFQVIVHDFFELFYIYNFAIAVRT
ncbi:MAG: hypothetical protein PF503_11565 [Desulfobacula sp.]|jgi:hypothetical protein|nr:hypothetical protein [Desulfobacula sp.]